MAITEVKTGIDGRVTVEYDNGVVESGHPVLQSAGALVNAEAGSAIRGAIVPARGRVDLSKQGLQIDTGVMTVVTGPSNTGQQATEFTALQTALPQAYSYNGADFATVVASTLTVDGELKNWVNPAAGVTSDLYIWNSNQTIDFQGYFECIVDSDDFAIVWNRVGASVGQPAASCWIKVDGKLITANETTTPNVTVGGNVTSWVRLSSGTRRQRLVQFSGDSWLYQIRLKNRYDTVRPVSWLEKFMLVGDSFCARSCNQGETVAPAYNIALGLNPPQTHRNAAISTMGAFTANCLGLDGVINNSANGTGFFSTFTANGKTWGDYLQRLQAVPTNARITHIHLWGTGNDLVNGQVGAIVGGRTIQQYQERIEQCIVEARRINPQARVTVSEILRVDAFDPRWTPTYIAPASAAARAACAAQSASFLSVGPSAPNASGLITGNGLRNSPNNSGNSDRYIGWSGSDNHPNSDAMPYLGAALAEAIRRVN